MKPNVIDTGKHTSTSTGKNSALRLSAVSKVYYGADAEGDVLALSDVTLDVAVGEFVVLLGPSGCGKSTLLQLIASLEGLTSGTIEFRDRSGPSQLQTCIVFQEFALFPWRSVVDNVGMAGELRGVPKTERREQAQQWIDLVGLRGFEGKYPHQLSGGMRQRVALARALASEPMVLLMDEPFGALDAQTRTKLQTELLRIWESTRKTVVFVTHSVEEAILLGDRIIVMGPRPGRIVEQVVVDIPRPRSLSDRHTSEFQELEERLWISLDHM